MIKSGQEYRTEITIYNVQSAATPKVDKDKLWFSCSARCLTVLYIYVEFHEYISNGFKLQNGHKYMMKPLFKMFEGQ